MRKTLSSLVIILLMGIVIYSQGSGTPSTLRVKTDANGYLLAASATQTNPVTQGTFSSRVLKTDANGSLLVVLTGTVTPTYPQAIPASTCAAPSLGLSGGATTGIAFTATPSILMCISGVAEITTIAASSTFAGNILFSAANSFDLGSSGYTNSVRNIFTSTVTALDQTVRATSQPVLDTSQTWNAGGVTFTGWKLNVTNTASASASLLMDLQVGSVSQFNVTRSGVLVTTGGGNLKNIAVDSLAGTALIRFTAAGGGLTNIVNDGNTIGIQINTGTAAPTFNNGTITSGSRNTTGQVTLTGGNTGGVLTFGAPNWTNTPFCTLTGSATTDTPHITAASSSTLTVAGITANGVFTYICIGRV